jgi:hypothetical protein
LVAISFEDHSASMVARKSLNYPGFLKSCPELRYLCENFNDLNIAQKLDDRLLQVFLFKKITRLAKYKK